MSTVTLTDSSRNTPNRMAEKLRRMRNSVVHGLTIPPNADLGEAGIRIREIAQHLEQIQLPQGP